MGRPSLHLCSLQPTSLPKQILSIIDCKNKATSANVWPTEQSGHVGWWTKSSLKPVSGSCLQKQDRSEASWWGNNHWETSRDTYIEKFTTEDSYMRHDKASYMSPNVYCKTIELISLKKMFTFYQSYILINFSLLF